MGAAPMPLAPSPLHGPFTSMIQQHVDIAHISGTFHDLSDKMHDSPLAKTSIGKALLGYFDKVQAMLEGKVPAGSTFGGANFSASGNTLQLGSNNLTGGFGNMMQGFMKNLPQAGGTFLNMFSSTTAASLSNNFLNTVSGDDPSDSPQARSSRTQQAQATPTEGTTPKSPRPEGMG